MFSHKFLDRVDHLKKSPEKGPIFLQFMECVLHIYERNPHAFEFNVNFIIYILDNINNCLYGNFLSNTNKNLKLKIAEKTISIWTYVKKNLKIFVNENYEEKKSKLHLDFSIKGLLLNDLWKKIYFKREHLFNYYKIENLEKKNNELETQNKKLMEQIEKLKVENNDIQLLESYIFKPVEDGELSTELFIESSIKDILIVEHFI
jgi:hypothetical protein